MPSEGNGNGAPTYDPQTTSGDTTQQSTAPAVDPLMSMLASIFSPSPAAAQQGQGAMTLQSLLSHPLIQQALQQYRVRAAIAKYPAPVRIPIPPPFPIGQPTGFSSIATMTPQPVKPVPLNTSAAMALLRALLQRSASLHTPPGIHGMFGGNIATADSPQAAPMAPSGSLWDLITRMSRSAG